ncbi:tetraspanin-31 isoform X2 [Rhinatrema bivittatum]|uniref:tetraspanin-31 isoform X2 n=1 Tax=Rhinatrema bivittatum TaxID=194408 RepID=UPI00112ACEA4|nr:tetraspanin-31 isoform X2 [Rhinatrema bivittatum]
MGCGGFTCLKNALCALNVVYMEQLLNATWASMTNKTRKELEYQLNCCGLLNDTNIQKDYAECKAPCIGEKKCQICGDLMLKHAGEALKILGGVGLFFSFTEILGVWLAVRYRNQKDPRANPSAFL